MRAGQVVIDPAAEVRGMNRAEFILDAVCEKAREVLVDQTQFALSRQALQDAVQRALQIFEQVGARALLCHAFDDAARALYLNHVFIESSIRGMAHINNFGVLYDDPTLEGVWLAPAYDLVCTTTYIPEDSLALTLGRWKSLFASRVRLMDFAKRCEIGDPRGRILTLLQAAEQGIHEHRAMLEEEPIVGAGIGQAFEVLVSRFSRG